MTDQQLSKTAYSNPRLGGFSLIELMVALVMGLFILGGAITILVNNQKNYRYNEDLGRVQENIRLALDLIGSDLRMAGYFGCAKPTTSNFTNHLSFSAGTVPALTISPLNAIEGYDQSASSWFPSGSSDGVGNIQSGTDAITIRKFVNSGAPLTADMPNPGGPISVETDAAGIAPGQLVAVYDCERTDIFRAAGVDMGANTVSPSAALSKAYEQNPGYLNQPSGSDPAGLAARAFVTRYDPVRYYIGNSASGQPALRKQYHNGTGVVDHELIGGVDAMQIFYGEDTDLDGAANAFFSANNVTNWNAVVAVKFNLVISSADEYGTEVDDRGYDIMDTPNNPDDDLVFNDRRTRKMVSSTVTLRNMQPKIQ